MEDNYAAIVRDNLSRFYEEQREDAVEAMGARLEGTSDFVFTAFGAPCRISPDGIQLGDRLETGVLGILISLYALHAQPVEPVLTPYKAFKEIPNAFPYVGAFASHAESILVPHVETIFRRKAEIVEALDGGDAPPAMGGDLAFRVRPLPKIHLLYIFYRADEDFPASATCLFSRNADAFLPVDGLADTGEYTSRTIRTLIGA